MRRFPLQVLIIVSAVVVIAVGVMAYLYIQRDSITRVATYAEWTAATSDGCTVVFVDCAWNIDVVRFRKPFDSFSQQCDPFTNVRCVTMMIDSNVENEVWDICQQLWQDNLIPEGGLKNLGGAGRVVWIKDGRVVDYAWCMEWRNCDETELLQRLAARTHRVFQ